MAETTSTRHFDSPSVLPAARVVTATTRATVGSAHAAAAGAVRDDPSLRLIERDGVVQQIVLRCGCQQEHRIQLDYGVTGPDGGQSVGDPNSARRAQGSES